ncbi:MAG TPA: glycine cleavage system protein GcvH [Thermodesulfobacteriota bacterium]|nr:glycine cleavage system protein GcvH [Thermodesulfobacteriota bacterium]
MTKVKFHQDHAWIRMEGEIGVIGISHYAQEQMGKIIYVELPEPGTESIAGEPLGALESSKVTSDLMAPVSGEVVESNPALEDEPTLVNDSPYDRGWITRVRLKNPAEFDALMEEDTYLARVTPN